MAEGKEIGRTIALYRQRRGLSQVEFARMIGRSEAWVSQVERGVRPLKDIELIERIADQLGVQLADLAPNAPSVVAEGIPQEAVPLRHILSANYALQAILTEDPVSDLTGLRIQVDRVWKLAHEARYDELVPLLETLLPKLEKAAQGVNSSEAFSMLAKSYHACAAALSKLQQFDAAWVAADRAVSDAGRAGDPLLMAEGAFRLTLVFQGARQLGQAEHTASTASNALESLVGDNGTPKALSVYGALQLQLAVIAARTERADLAWEYLDRAREVADRIGADRNYYNTEFGPTNVSLHEVAVAVELGDAGEAVRRAAGIDARALSRERQGRLLIDIARAWAQRRNIGKALAALEEAEQITPEQVRNHRLVQTMVRDLLRMEPNPPAALRAFAERVGIIV
jgi:transcriptional regulator with XRE-family HTH domain